MKDDEKVQRDVMDQMKWEMGDYSTRIGVAVKDGVVTLSGHVHCFPAKWAAERAVKRVLGVRAVAEEIEVRLPGSDQRTNTDLARAAENALDWNTLVPKNRVRIMVEDGTITMEGSVDNWSQRVAVEKAINSLTGVKAINNRIAVKPVVEPKEVEKDIMNALTRHAQLDARLINVESHGDRVVLSGSVRTWAEREEAEEAARAAPGVADIENNITVVS
ncbi:MAG TPA: BON domain-containing protein [Deltaproteobacteria bacterium]|nr:BON domain-containing protein [Deltaproteobacteria bacterium]